MSDKPTGPKKKAKPAPRVAAAKRSTPKATAQKPTFYVTASTVGILVDRQPSGTDKTRKFATFDAARSAALDALIATIERAEHDLTQLKRAGSYEDLQAARKSNGLA